MEDAPESLWPQLMLITAVAVPHMTMPNHWLPYSLVARAHAWSLRTVLLLTSLGALGHVSATVIVCAAISGVGGALLSHDSYTALSSVVLLILASYYLYSYAVRRDRTPCCDASTTASTSSTLPKPSTAGGPASVPTSSAENAVVQRTAAVSLVALTTLSPCVGSMPIVLTVLSPPVQLSTLVSVWATLLASAMSVMLPLVALSFLGAASLPLHRVRRHERLILGLALAALAALTLFVLPRLEHHHHHGEHGGAHDHSHHARHGAAVRGSAGGAEGHENHDGHGVSFDAKPDGVHVVRGGMRTSGEAKLVDGVPFGANLTAGGGETLPHETLRMAVDNERKKR